MATANITFTGNGLQFNLTLTFAGAATSGQAIAISGTAGSANVIQLTNYVQGNNIISATAPHVDDFGLSFRTDGPDNGNDFNIYDLGFGVYQLYQETPGGVDTDNFSTVDYSASTNTDPTVNFNTGSIVAEGGTDTVTSSELDFNDAEQADTAITYMVTSAATNGTLFRDGNALGVNGTFTQADINANLITYSHNGGETISASFGFSVSDGKGSTVSGQTFNFTVTPVNDAPMQTTNTGRTLSEGGFTSITAAQLTFKDAEQGPGALTYTVTTATANGTLSLNGGAIGLNDTFTQADIDAGNVFYLHNGGETTTDSFGFSVSDGQSGSVTGQSFAITVNAVDDAATGNSDAFSIGEATVLGAHVFSNNGFGADTDVDSTLTVTAVNGVAVDVGKALTLASGALLTLNANGTFSYNPNGKFDDLPGSGSGATNLTRDDSFTYAVNGVTATVTVTLIGVDSDGDVLRGTPGFNDSLAGGIGSDSYFVDDAGDTIVEVASEGTADRVYARSSFSLAADDDIEVLSTGSSTGKIAIDLKGNALAQTIYGNAGANTLHDGGTDGAPGPADPSRADRLVGLGGNDTYVVYNSAARVVEAAGQGNDRVSAGVDYKLASGVSVEFLNTTALGSLYAVNLTGNSLAQTIRGNDGANVLNDGGAGAADTLIGGKGDDHYVVYNSGDTITELAGEGTDRVSTFVDFALTAGAEIEVFTTTNSKGTSAIDLTGNAFGQSITGNVGDNRLDGGDGSDTLTGAAGADTYVFSTALGAGNIDTIAGYSVAADGIELASAIFATLATGALSDAAFAANAGGTATDAAHRILYDAASGALSYDADGDGGGAAQQFATLAAGLAMTAGEFTVV